MLLHSVALSPNPNRNILFLHGILGSGGNLRTLAKELTTRCPEVGALLVDLRGHGRSADSAEGFTEPNTLAAVRDDVLTLMKHVREQTPVVGAVGHSFGGKVALSLRGAAPPNWQHTVVIDTSPSPKLDASHFASPLHAVNIVALLQSLPTHFASRQEFSTLLQNHQLPKGIVDWLAMNLRADGEGYRFGLDLNVIDQLLADYHKIDAWPWLAPNLPGKLVYITGADSDSVSQQDRARLSSMPHVITHDIPGAGHWVHTDAPDAVSDILAAEFTDYTSSL